MAKAEAKIGQIWSFDRAPHLKVKILQVIGYRHKIEVIERDESKQEFIEAYFKKGRIEEISLVEDRYTLYCTRYEEK